MEYQDYKEFISIEGLRKQVSISPMTRNEICEKAGINTNTLDPLLSRTKNQLTRIDTIAKLAYALDCKIDDLIEFKGIKFKDTCACYSRMPMDPKPELSYAPLFDMYYDLYSSNFKAKLEKALEKVHAVEVKSIQKTEVKNEAISYRQRINAGKPLTLPALYEICKVLKCTPGCVFGCKGKYNYEIEENKLQEIKTEEPKDSSITNRVISAVLENGNKKIPLIVTKKYDRWILPNNKLTINIAEIGKAVIYGDTKESLLYKDIPETVNIYTLEAINENSDAPYYVNGRWRKYIRIVSGSIEYLYKYTEEVYGYIKYRKLYIEKNHSSMAVLHHYNGEDCAFYQKHFSIPSLPIEEDVNKRELILSPYHYLLNAKKNKKSIKLFSKYFENLEVLSRFKFCESIENYQICE